MLTGCRFVLTLYAVGVVLIFGESAHATTQTTSKGKIVSVEGHTAPTCRRVGFKDNSTGSRITFRIPGNTDANTDSGIASVALAALIANRDVLITYDPAVTAGCGTEPAITYIEVD